MSEFTEPQDPRLDPDGEAEERDDAVIAQAFRWSLVVIAIVAVAAGGTVYWVTREPPAAASSARRLAPPAKRDRPAAVVPRVRFTDITRRAGITFVHENGAYGDKLLPETMGGGCAFFDFDNDGDQDLLLVNSCHWPWHRPPAGPAPTMALYRNVGKGNFEDVTAACGLAVTLYGMGAAVGDYDNDGWVDVFISAVGPNRLFQNRGGKFTDVTETAGVAGADDAWSTSCGWFDHDNDGKLDLFICNYLVWSKEIDLALDCRLTGHGRGYCRPSDFEGTFPYLYRNDGGGKFTDVSARAGVEVRNPRTGVPLAKSLGVAPVDVDGDGLVDLVVANDTVQNLLFRNRGEGAFMELGDFAGVAFDNFGNARGAMGIDSAWFRNDRALGVAIGNFANEMTALYVSRGDALEFTDDTIATGLGPPSRLMLKFGVFFFDYDLDGRLDVFTANGHLENEIHKVQKSQQYEQPPQLFWNCGPQATSEFALVPADQCGAEFAKPMVGRGATFADIDLDGDLDVLITAIGSPPRLLRNDQDLGHHYLRVKLVGRRSNRDAIGARVEVPLGSQILRQHVMPTRSYLSQSELPLTFGLGKVAKVERLIIRWPDGSTQEVADVPVDRQLVIEQAPAGESATTTAAR